MATNFLLNILLKSYFNIIQIKRLILNRRRDNKIRYSANKVYTSRAELQHTNNKSLISLFTYNKKKSSIEEYTTKLATLIKFRRIIVQTKKIYLPNHKNRIFHLLKNKFLVFNK